MMLWSDSGTRTNGQNTGPGCKQYLAACCVALCAQLQVEHKESVKQKGSVTDSSSLGVSPDEPLATSTHAA